MEAVILFLVPLAAGISLAVFLCFISGLRPAPLSWPTLFFLVVLGTAANNVSAVWYAGAGAILPSSGGFFGGDNLTVAITGLALALLALPGLVICLFFSHKSAGQPHPISGWLWSWLTTQSILSTLIFLMGFSLGFQTWPNGFNGSDHPGLPLRAYLILIALLCLGLGLFFGARWGGTGSAAVPLVGLAVLCALSGALVWGMLAQANDPAWGLSLIQTPAGLWYARLNLPAALLLGDYEYAWGVSAPGIWLSALAPHLLFTGGYLAPRLFKRGNENV